MGLLLQWMWRSLKMLILLLLLGTVAVGGLRWSVRPTSSALDDRRGQLAQEVAVKLAESLPVPSAGRPSIVVLPFERDPTGSVTDAVRRAVERVDRYQVEPVSLWENLCRRLGFRVEPVNMDDAPGLGKHSIPADYILAGRVVTLSARSDMDEATLEGVLAAIGTGTVSKTGSEPVTEVGTGALATGQVADSESVIQLRAEAVHDHRAEGNQTASGIFSQPTRWLVWLMTAFCVPWLFASMLTRGLAEESNGLNLAMLLGLTGVSSFAAWALLELPMETQTGATLLVLTVILGFAYNGYFLTRLEEMRH